MHISAEELQFNQEEEVFKSFRDYNRHAENYAVNMITHQVNILCFIPWNDLFIKLRLSHHTIIEHFPNQLMK